MFSVNAPVTPAVTGSSSGPFICPTAGRKKHSKRNGLVLGSDMDQSPASSSPLAISAPITTSSRSPPVALTAPPPPSPHNRSTTTLPRKKKSKGYSSMSFVSLIFNRNTQPSRSDTASLFTDNEPIKFFGRSESRAETRSPSPLRRRLGSHRLSRSVPNSLSEYLTDGACEEQETLHPLALFTPLFPSLFGVTPSPTSLDRFQNSYEYPPKSSINVSGKRSPASSKSMLQGEDDKRGRSPFLADDVTNADELEHEDDACSAISSICFAEDPDDKPPKKSNRVSTTTVISCDGSSPSRFNRESFVLDISSANKIVEDIDETAERGPLEEGSEDEDVVMQTRRKTCTTKSANRLLRTLGELPPQLRQTHRKRHSYSFISLSSSSSRRSSFLSSAEDSASWSLPDIPTISPICPPPAMPTLTYRSQPSTPTGLSSNNMYTQRKRSSSLHWSGIDGLTTVLKPLSVTRGTHQSNLFKLSAVPSPPPLSSRFAPPGLNVANQSRTCKGSDTADDCQEKSEKSRDSFLSDDSTLSDLHCLPASLTRALDDSHSDRQSVVFDTAPSSPVLSTLASPTSTFASGSGTQSPVSAASTTALSHPSSHSSIATAAANDPTSTQQAPCLPTASLLPPCPSPLPSRSPTHPPLPSPPPHSLCLLPASTTYVVNEYTVSPTASGAEVIIDPADSEVDETLVSPIVFAPSDEGSDEESYDHDVGDYMPAVPEKAEHVEGTVSLFLIKSEDKEGEEMGIEEKEEDVTGRAGEKEVKRRHRIQDINTWGSVRVPLRQKGQAHNRGVTFESGAGAPVPETGRGPISRKSSRLRRTWVGEWNVDMQDVIKQLRSLR